MPAPERVRDAVETDVPAMHAIYAPYVTDTVVSFEAEPPTLAVFGERVRQFGAHHACLVIERDGVVVGYAYGGPHRARAAYRWSVETSVYIAPAAQGQGLGRRLYEALLPRLADAGYCNAFAGVAQPNAASGALHRAVGFTPIGVFPRVGWKFGAWHDVAWFHRPLREAPPEAPPPTP
jgi:L-amino acid N-acyltransferase YncA